jgi:hypothetical protein
MKQIIQKAVNARVAVYQGSKEKIKNITTLLIECMEVSDGYI